MCDPTGGFLIAGIAMSAAASTASFASQYQNAQTQGKFQAKRYTENAKIATDNYTRVIGQSGIRQSQEGQAAAQQAEAALVQGERVRSAAQVAAAAGGIGGNSVDELFQDYGRQAVATDNAIATNLSWKNQQAGEDLRGAEMQTRGSIASATPQPIQMPSLLATGLQIGGSIASGIGGIRYANAMMGGGGTAPTGNFSGPYAPGVTPVRYGL